MVKMIDCRDYICSLPGCLSLLFIGSRKPLARIVDWHQVGLEPELMGLGPVQAIRGLLNKVKWSMDSVDVFEINEAFAAQTVAVSLFGLHFQLTLHSTTNRSVMYLLRFGM